MKTKSLQELLVTSIEKRIEYVNEMKLEALQALADELIVTVSENPEKFLSSNAIISMIKRPQIRGNLNMLQQNVNKLIKQFPEPKDKGLALDREFSSQEAKFNEIINDINNQKLPTYRYLELLNENLYIKDEHGSTSRTFLAYAFPKLQYPEMFLQIFKMQLGQAQFNLYMETPLLLAGKEDSIDIRRLYLENHLPFNLNEFEALKKNEQLKNILIEYAPKEKDTNLVNEINNVDTHNESSHRSADESHIAAFKAMLASNAELKDVNAEYSVTHPGALERTVKITNRTGLDSFVQDKLNELQHKIQDLLLISQPELYDTYLRPSDISLGYDALDQEEKTAADKKIKSLLWQANAAKRFMDNMINDHKCNGGSYKFNTNDAASCGLTMEEMVATCYWASQDRGNFKTSASNSKDSDIFFTLIRQLYDMRRGYNIDRGVDKPEDNIFPDSITIDDNRCHGGCVNSLANALNSIHKFYNVILITRRDIEIELRNNYEGIIKSHSEFIPLENKLILKKWINTGKVTGDLKAVLESIFNELYRAKFEDTYKGYIKDEIFKEVIHSGLDNIPIPKELKDKWSIEILSNDEIMDSIVNDILPHLHFNHDKGYENTLNYLKRERKEDIIEYLITQALKMSITNSKAQDILLYLSRSKLGEQFQNIVIHKIEDKEILLKDISFLSFLELKELAETKDLKSILHISIVKNMMHLFAFYGLKFGFTISDIQSTYSMNKSTVSHVAVEAGHAEILKVILLTEEGKKSLTAKDKDGRTPLHLAAQMGRTEVVKVILATKEGKESLVAKDNIDLTPLHLAALNGHTEVVKVILETEEGKKSLTSKDKDVRTPLHLAAQFGRTEVVKVILETEEGKKSLTAVDWKVKTPLHCAAQKGHTEVVKVIFETEEGKKSLTAKDKDGRTPLHLAAQMGRTEVVKVILATKEGKESLVAKDNNDLTPLHLAALNGHTEVVKVILETEEGKKSLAAQDNNDLTPLHWAVSRGYTEVVKTILLTEEGKKSLTAKDKNDKTPLHIAAELGRTEVVKVILETEEGKKSLAAKDRNVKTPLYCAALNGHTEVIKVILETEEGKKSLAIQNGVGYTPLFIAVQEGHLEVVKAILATKEGKESLAARDKNDKTPLHIAAELGRTEVVKVILETEEGKKSLTAVNKDGRTPLHLAAEYSHTEVVKAIFATKEGKESLAAKDKDGRTPLHWAVSLNNIEVVKAILATEEGKKSLTANDNNGLTPLHWAVSSNNIEVVKAILATEEGKKSLVAKDKDGRTPLQLATQNGNVEVMTEISNHSKSPNLKPSNPTSVFYKPHLRTPLALALTTTTLYGVSLSLTTLYTPLVVMGTSVAMGAAVFVMASMVQDTEKRTTNVRA